MKKIILLVIMLIGCNPKEDKMPTCEEYIPQQNRLIGGEETKAFPEVGKLVCGSKTCSSTLIKENVILTAKHCVDKCEPGLGYVLFKAFTRIYVSNFIKHDKYDIALGILNTNVDIESREVSDNTPEIGSTVLLIGYGQYEIEPTLSSINPRYGCSPINDLLSNEIHFYNSENVSSLCFGDSGGPTYFNNKIIGVHSYVFDDEETIKCGRGTAVDVRVDVCFEWINFHLSNIY